MERLNNFKPTAAQLSLVELAKDKEADRLLAYGGSRSGKSVGWSFVIAGRGFLYPGSKHGIYRATLNTCRTLLFEGTFREVMEICWPGYLGRSDVDINKSESTITFHNGSKFFFRGLDENRTNRILGAEYATIWVNECNEIVDYSTILTLANRLNHTTPMLDRNNQPVMRDGAPLMIRPKMFFDCNPQFTSDWDCQAFKLGVHPVSGLPHKRPQRWKAIKLNPEDNRENQAREYLENLEDDYEGMPGMVARFVEGEWRENNPLALFKPEMLSEKRPFDKSEATLLVIGVDPAVTSNAKSDETGIVVAGADQNGIGHVMADLSGKYGVEQWAQKVVDAFDEWDADYVVIERNQGGELVENALRQIRRNLPVKTVHASTGKVARADPVAIAYSKGQVFHTEQFKYLEQQMFDFEAVVKARGRSPDRVDALVYALTDVLDIRGTALPAGGGTLVRGNRR